LVEMAPTPRNSRGALLTVYCLFFYAVLLFFASHGRLFSQYRAISFHYNRDLLELCLIGTGLPRYMISHPWTYGVADAGSFLLPALIAVHFIVRRRFSVILGVIFTLWLLVYFLLMNIFWEGRPEPYVIYFLLSFAFMATRDDRFEDVLFCSRWYFLYFFSTAALWKILRGAIFNLREMSNILLVQHSSLLAGPCSGLRCRFYGYLIDHPFVSWLFYLAAVLLEAAFLVGFFTRRWDRWLAVLAIVFVIADYWVMQLPYWQVLVGLYPLLVRRSHSVSPAR
jgi:hypothetical protein